jgi:PPOX class probable F420-dependent enzyme
MDLTADQRRFLEAARVGRLATADADARPAVVPVCFALVGDAAVSPLDEKPKSADPTDLRRVRDLEANPHVALAVDRYAEDWDRLAWVQLRGTAALVEPGAPDHDRAVAALEAKYDQYADHDLATRPLLWIDVGHARSWGTFDDPGSTAPGDGCPPDA